MWRIKKDFEVTSAYVDVEANRILNAAIIWYASRLLEDDKVAYADVESKILAHYPYVVKTGQLFSHCKTDENDKKILTVERYGGFGIGYNSGGVRCANIDSNVQVKGIGKSPLAGEKQDEWHSYGGLRLSEALQEVIYSEVLNIVLPHGTVNCLALLGIGEQLAKPPSANGKEVLAPAALLVRERSVRPAHFIRAGFNNRRIRQGQECVTDLERCRRTNIQFGNLIGGLHRFPSIINHFIGRAMAQQSFAILLRMAHGAMTPSNISIDGRWLDVTVATAVQGRTSYLPSFADMPTHDELDIVMGMAEEWTHSFGKFNRLRVSLDEVRNISQKYLAVGSLQAMRVVFGQANSKTAIKALGKLETPCRRLLAAYNSETAKRLTLTDELPKRTDFSDPISSFLEEMCRNSLLSIGRRSVNQKRTAMIELFYSAGIEEESLRKAVIAGTIRCLRKAYFTVRFSRAIIVQEIENVVSTGVAAKQSDLIRRMRACAEWMFGEEDTRKVTLVRTSHLWVFYNLTSDEINLEKRDGQLQSIIFPFRHSEDLYRHIESLSPNYLVEDGFDFRPGLIRIIELVYLTNLECSNE